MKLRIRDNCFLVMVGIWICYMRRQLLSGDSQSCWLFSLLSCVIFQSTINSFDIWIFKPLKKKGRKQRDIICNHGFRRRIEIALGGRTHTCSYINSCLSYMLQNFIFYLYKFRFSEKLKIFNNYLVISLWDSFIDWQNLVNLVWFIANCI